MKISDVFTARSVAERYTSDPSNAEEYLGIQFFPNQRKMGIDLRWIKTHKGVGVALKPSAFDALATIRQRGGFQAVNAEMPLFRESMTVSERDMEEILRAQDNDDPYLLEALGHVYDDIDELVTGADVSAERMRMALMAPIDGEAKIKIGMADNTVYNYDYDPDGSWKASHYMELSGTDTWDNADSAKPLNDINAAVNALYEAGAVAAYIVMNNNTFNYLSLCEQMQKFAATGQFGVVTDFLNTTTARNIITAQTGLTPLVYNKMYKDYDGNTNKFFPDGYVSIIGANTLGSTWYGVTPEERTLLGDAKVDVSVLDSGVAVAVQTLYGPPVTVSTTASQIALPSFEGMDELYTMKVLA